MQLASYLQQAQGKQDTTYHLMVWNILTIGSVVDIFYVNNKVNWQHWEEVLSTFQQSVSLVCLSPNCGSLICELISCMGFCFLSGERRTAAGNVTLSRQTGLGGLRGNVALQSAGYSLALYISSLATFRI